MKTNIRRLTRYIYAGLAAGVLGVTFLPILTQSASAAQVTTRSMELSTAVPSATGVSYQLTFTPVSTEQELIVDFCGDTPLIGASCAFSAATVPNVASVTSSLGTATAIGSGTPKHTIKVTGLTMTASTPYTITFTNMINPSSATSFYARVLTYATGTTNYTQADTTGGSTTPGAYVDYGGIAMSTVTQITISAAVMETLTFCASTGDMTASNCGSATGSVALSIGRGTPVTLSANFVDTANVFTQISTNASTGAIVRMKAGNSCSGASGGGLSSNGGSTCAISGLNNTSAAAMTQGTGTFGMYVSTGALSSGGSGATVADANYHNTSHTTIATDLWYGMDNSNVTSTYGDPIFTTNGAPCSAVNNQLVFAATASPTTPAGIYTGSESLIATGTF